MKKLIVFLFCMGFLLVYQKQFDSSFESYEIDPGFFPSWEGYEKEYHFFDTKEQAIEHLNKHGIYSADLYKVEKIPLKRIDKEVE